MRSAYIAAAVWVAVSSGPVAAATCKAAPPPAAAPIARSVWEDTAKFSFLIGREPADASNGMTLMTRLRPLPVFDALRAGAAEWGSSFISSGYAAERIAELAGYVNVLEDLCRQLDAAGFDDVAFDRIAWTARLDDVRARVDAAKASGPSFMRRTGAYADASAAVAKLYGDRAFPPNPFARIGPEPVLIAAAIGDFEARWRAIFADLEFVASILPTPGADDEATIEFLTTAATTLASVVARGQAISANAMEFADFRHFLGGDYLYDECPIAEGTWVWLDNLWYAGEDGVLTVRPVSTEVRRRYSPALGDGVAIRDAQLWRIDRAGEGYWTLTAKAVDRTAYLDLWQLPGGVYGVALSTASRSREPLTRGQFWRCYGTEQNGAFRFSNALLGEGFSMDTYADSPEVIMAETGNFGAQYWRPREN